MMKFITSNPLVAGLIGVALVAAIVAFFVFGDKKEQRIENKLEEKGVITERARSQEEVIKSVENANDAVRNPQPDDLERMRSRYDRSHQNNQ